MVEGVSWHLQKPYHELRDYIANRKMEWGLKVIIGLAICNKSKGTKFRVGEYQLWYWEVYIFKEKECYSFQLQNS